MKLEMLIDELQEIVDSAFKMPFSGGKKVVNAERIQEIVKNNEASIATKVLADEVRYGEANEDAKKWNINGEDVSIGVVRK